MGVLFLCRKEVNHVHPQIFNLQNELIAVLQNAFKIGYTKIKNNLWTCQFTMPLNDKKNDFIKPKHFIDLYDHDKYIGKFIVNPKRTFKSVESNEITYECEHVLSLLHSDVLFGYHQYSNYPTDVVLNGLMDSQEVKHWRLGQLDFNRYFHYGWENEDSLLNAIMSIPKPFNEPYIWTWDDTEYPFTLNLVHPNDTLKGTIVAGKNLRGIEINEDPTNIVTRIYPLGAGEGINQLNISEINDGVVYLEDATAIEKYGLHKRIWVDSRFEDVESLKASGQAILDKFKQPIRSVSIDAIDYSRIDPYELSNYDVGDVLLIYDEDTGTDEEIQLEKIDKSDIYGMPYDMKLELGSVVGDITTTFADLEKKQLVNDTYSQGATNIDSRDFMANCDVNYPAIIRFPIPEDVVNINEMVLTFETLHYRAYSKAVQGGGAIAKSTAAGGGTVTSTGGGGGVATSTQGGGGVISSTGAGGSSVVSSSAENYRPGPDGHNHNILDGTYLALSDGSSRLFQRSGQHEHTIQVPNHTHSLNLPNHTHDLTLPNHTHNLSIPDHSHQITLPDHTHEIEYGIFESPALPSAVTIKVDGVAIPHTETYGDHIDLVPYLEKETSGRIARGRYAEIIIRPNGLALINATVSSRLFIQSRIGGTF